MNDGGWTEANVVAAAVRILGGAQTVADSLGVSRSQVYRWIKARSMARATYFYVAKLANLSGIEAAFLGGDGSPAVSHGDKEASAKQASRPSKAADPARLGIRNRTHRTRTTRPEEKLSDSKQSLNGAIRVGWQEVPERHVSGEEPVRIEAQKGGIQQNCLIQSNGVTPGGGDHYGRRKTLRTKGQEESREHQS
jgi:hypothetical protein